jgi:iron(III) transport system permease protein
MSWRTRLVNERAVTGSRPGLVLLCGAIALIVLFPLSWLFIRAVGVDQSRAWELLLSPGTREVIANSLLLMGGVTLFSVLLGVPLAYLTVRTNLPFRRFWSVAVALPLVVPSYIGAFAFVSMFGPRGEVFSLLEPLGLEQLPTIYGLPGSILVITLYTFPYVFLTTRASLLSFDTRLVEAARTLNHSQWQVFRRVTLPHVRPAIAAGSLLAALYAVSDFGTPAIMRLPVFTRQIYVEYRAFGQDYAALLSMQLLALVLLVLVLEWWIRPDQDVQTEGGEGAGDNVVDLGRWRWPATLFPLGVSTLALAVPIAILLLWLVRADSGGRPSLAFQWGYALNSVTVAAAAALVAALAALPIAYYAATSESRLATVFERATYVGFAVPGIVLALALVYFGAGYVPSIYQTLPLLIFAYVIRFMPQAVGTIRTNTLQVDQQLMEAARTLGQTPIGAFRRITLPLIAPGVSAGAALVFLTTMRELPATLVLRPTGFDTLVTQIWRAQDAAYFQYAALPALLLLFVSGLSMLVLLSQEGTDID